MRAESRDLATLRLEDFLPLMGGSFQVWTEANAAIEFKLVEGTASVAGNPYREQPFSLIFEGEGPFPQGTYCLDGPLGTVELFLVPVGLAGSGFLYQAIFN